MFHYFVCTSTILTLSQESVASALDLTREPEVTMNASISTDLPDALDNFNITPLLQELAAIHCASPEDRIIINPRSDDSDNNSNNRKDSNSDSSFIDEAITLESAPAELKPTADVALEDIGVTSRDYLDISASPITIQVSTIVSYTQPFNSGPCRTL